MDYNLAKELNEAGFRRIYFTCDRAFKDNNHECRCDKPDCILRPINEPNLEELIKAINNLIKVITFIDCEDYKKVAFTSHTITGEQTIFEGKSYEECLAKMWLHLMSYKSY